MSLEAVVKMEVSECNLKIYKSSISKGSSIGGDEMILLTSYVDFNDIEVEFADIDSRKELKWRKKAEINKSETYNNYSIVVTTPSYREVEVEEMEVGIRLLKPSTGEYSETIRFVYFYKLNDDGYSDQMTYARLKMQYESCVSKMNSLAERTGRGILQLSVSNKLEDLIKTQRYLLSSVNDDGNSPLHLSILHGNLNLLIVFVEVAATIPSQNIINIRNNLGFTALLIAAYLGEVSVVEFLLEANADYTILTRDGMSILHIACKNRNIELLKSIICKLDNNIDNILNLITNDGFTALHLAILSESADIVNELLRLDSLDVNIRDKNYGYTALHYACLKETRCPMVSMLCKNNTGACVSSKGGKVDVNSLSYIDSTPLHVAMANKNYMSVICLVVKGARLDMESKSVVKELVSNCELIEYTKLLQNCIDKVFSNRQSGVSVIGSSENLNSICLEIKQLFDEEVLKRKSVNDVKLDMKNCSINNKKLDCMYYAREDAWMLSILEAKKTIPRVFVEKLLCFERIKSNLLAWSDEASLPHPPCPEP